MSQLRTTSTPPAGLQNPLLHDASRTARFVGMDEAGYGPNLGPLVICATVWRTPQSPASCDFYKLLADAVSAEPDSQGTRLHVADSKQVYSPAGGIEGLERSALALLGAAGLTPQSWRELVALLQGNDAASSADGPWYEGRDLPLPMVCPAMDIAERTVTLRSSLLRCGMALERIRAAVVEPHAFNAGLKAYGNKAELLSRTAFRLLRGVWDPADERPTLVVGDKHGGRNRYDLLLADVLDGAMIFRLEERRPISRYRVGRTELRFQTNGEQHLPVAAGSIIAKYVREVSMELFNRFWISHLPDLKPTKGYPGDSKRFRRDVKSKLKELGISEAIFWRKR